MFQHFLLSTYRSLRRQKGYLLINVLGLGLGILCTLVIFLKVNYELGFDTYHPESERIYRILAEDNNYGEWERDAAVPFPLPPAVKAEFPGIEAITLVDQHFFECLITVKQADGSVSWFQEGDGVIFTEPDFFPIFAYEWIAGDPETALEQPNSVVISETLAKKYFADASPMGRTLEFDDTYTLTITGLVKAPPQQTDLPFKLLILIPEDRRSDNWGHYSSSRQCYLKLLPGQDPADLDALLPELIRKNRGEDMPDKLHHFLQPLAETHHDTEAHAFGTHSIAKETLPWLSVWIPNIISVG